MEVRHRVLGVMFTMTTYGAWLRGDGRGWVEDGVVFPPNPEKESADRERLLHPPFLFSAADLLQIGEAMGRSLIDRLRLRVFALTVQRWHVHFVVSASTVFVGDIAKCAKESVRYLLRPSRPIWTGKYDKRFCLDEASLQTRIAYVERHNTESGLAARPWPFLS